MDSDKSPATCGCSCESCRKGDHVNCTSPADCNVEPEDTKEETDGTEES